MTCCDRRVCSIGQLRAADKLIAVDHNSDAGLGRISHVEGQLSRAPINSGRHRLLAKAIRIDAALFRKSLNSAHASEPFDPNPKCLLRAEFRSSAYREIQGASNERESDAHSSDRARPGG